MNLNDYTIKELNIHLNCWKKNNPNSNAPHYCLDIVKCATIANIVDKSSTYKKYRELAPLLQDYIIKRELDELINDFETNR